MDYDAYGRPQQGRGSEQPGYFESPDATQEYSRHYPSEQRDRDNLNPPRWNHVHQRYSPPILSERMASAPAARSGSAEKGTEGVSPELLAAITEKVKREVMEHLKQTGSVEAPPMQRQRSKESTSTSSPPPSARKVYTPPSPAQQPPRASYGSPPPVDFTRSQYPQPPTDSSRSQYPPPPKESVRSPPGSPLDKPSGVRFTDRGPPRPIPPGHSYSTAELSAVDNKWGRLFDHGNPTQRLGQFLRGLANHIIEEFEPKKSIVVTPDKMAQYYRLHSLEKEPYPLLSIFQSQSSETISQLYQDLGCQHHLIQEQASSPCTIPALTPLGFAHWMTLHILAYPEDEWKRMEKVVLAMPINADGEMVDGKPERLPKQISRYLLPEVEERKTRKLLDGAIKDFLEDLGSTPRRKKSIASPPPLNRQPSTSHSRRNSQSRRQPVEIHQDKNPPTTAKPLERERAPYAGAPGSDVSSSNDDSVKIERDRQPYVSQPGGNGRVYENLNPSHNRPKRANSTSRTRESNVPEIRHSRNNSDARDHRDSYLPPRSSNRRTSSPHMKSFSNSTPIETRSSNRRTSSPPMKSFSNSTPIDINSSNYGHNSTSSTSFTPNPNTFNPRSYGSGNPPFPPPPPVGERREAYSGRIIPEEDTTPRSYGSGNPPFPPPPPVGERREAYSGRIIPDEDTTPRFSDFNSPRDAEKWDRYEDSRAAGDVYERGGSVSVDPRDNVPRGAPTEDWYRDSKPRASGYDDFATRRY